MALTLHIPAYDELWYRQKLLADPATMGYNRGYDLGFPGYDRETGCIAFPETEWRAWYDSWVGQEPECFYAYIADGDGRFLGEVDLYQSGEGPWYEMGVVVEDRYRGKGYGRKALALLLDYAFTTLKAGAVHNSFEVERTAALRLHLAAGFQEIGREKGVVYLERKREAHETEGENTFELQKRPGH